MEILTAVKKLHATYKDPSIGCLDRANALYYIMKKKGLKPKIEFFFFQNNNRDLNHFFVVLKNEVYDANFSELENPILFEKYKEMQNNKYKSYNLIWKSWDEYIHKHYFPIDFFWNYVKEELDEDLQNEIIPLIKDEYDAYLKVYPQLKK